MYNTLDTNESSDATNRHLIYGEVGVSPMKDVNLWAQYTNVRFARSPRPVRATYAGDEIDAKMTYDYTEDVQLKLIGAAFIPGAYYDEVANSNVRSNDTAYEVIGSAAVKF